MPWDVHGSSSSSLTPPGNSGRSRDSSPPYFSASRPTAIGTAAKPAQRGFLAQTDTQSATGSAIGASVAGVNGYNNHDTPSKNGHNAFSNSNLSSNVAKVATFSMSNGDMNGSDNANGHFGFRSYASSNFGPPGKSMTTPYTHLSHNSLGTFSHRPTHSSHSSFHSDSDGNEPRDPRVPNDLVHAFNKFNFENAPYGPSQSGLQRPAYVSHSSFDGSLSHFKMPLGADDMSGSILRTCSPESFSEMALYQSAANSRHGERGIGSPSLNNYARNVNPQYYAVNRTSSTTSHRIAGSQFNGHFSDEQGDFLDRKISNLHHEQDYVPSSRPVSSRALAHFQGHGYGNYPAGRMDPMANFYPMAPYSGYSMNASRNSYREQDVSHSMRSPLLEEFRANSKGNKRYELKVSTFLLYACPSPALDTY